MSEWTDAKKGVPEDGRHVLICLCGSQVFVGNYRRKDNKWRMGFESKPVLGVTHWMPLPEPPK